MDTLGTIRSLVRPEVSKALAVLAAIALAAPAGARASSWPRQFDSSSGTFIIYQPQPEDLVGDVLSGRAAFSLQKTGTSNPNFGVLWFNEHIVIDRDSSTVTAREFDVTKVRLPSITPADASSYEKLVEAEAAGWDLSGSLEELQTGLAATEKERASVAQINNAPPRILFHYQRAILVVYDGAPTRQPIEGTNLERVANTPYAVVYDPSDRLYYLNGANLWYSAKDPLGPWADIPGPPDRVRAAVPPDTSSEDQVRGTPPEVLTATAPTELISIDGPPQYAPLVGDELLYISNTESDVVREVSTQAIYVLLAGRWYRAATPEGPWTFVRGDQLPASFRQVPPDSPKGNILASVAGTDQANDAIADAEIPQTSAIQRSATDFAVTYDGAPQFEAIAGTNLRYAVNADAEVILADGRYYACDQGVWYISDQPTGPWSVSETRPIGVDDIPPSCPVYDARYVYIYDATPSWVYMGYLPGYFGCYPYYGTVVYGTGYVYRPWRGRHHYYPRPCTWGFHARYNPWFSRWSFGYSYGTGFLRVGSKWPAWRQPGHRYSPPLWFGPGGYRRPLMDQDYALLRTRRPGRPRPGLPNRLPANLYNRPENAPRVDRTAVRMPVRPVVSPSRPPVPRPSEVFAGRDGRVYQRDPQGSWTVNEGRSWKPTPVPNRSPATPVPVGGLTPGATGTGSVSPGARPAAQPMPARAPTAGEAPSRNVPRAQPAPPAISPMPGNLEREFQARQRAREVPPPTAAAPAGRPAPTTPQAPRPVQSKEKGPGERKP
jgi:hypothetical protein